MDKGFQGDQAGRPPFEHQSDAAVLDLHQKATVPDVRDFRSEVSGALATIVTRMLAKEPRDRWQSAGEVKSALEGVTG